MSPSSNEKLFSPVLSNMQQKHTTSQTQFKKAANIIQATTDKIKLNQSPATRSGRILNLKPRDSIPASAKSSQG